MSHELRERCAFSKWLGVAAMSLVVGNTPATALRVTGDEPVAKPPGAEVDAPATSSAQESEADRKAAEVRAMRAEHARRRAIAGRLESRGRSLVNRLASAEEAALVFEGTMALLSHGRFREHRFVDFQAAITKLATVDWKPGGANETAGQMLQRLADEALSSNDEILTQYRSLADEYEAALGEPWKFAWQAHREEMLDLAETVLQARAAKSPSELWGKRVASATDAERADWYRLCWIATLATGAVSPDQVDEALLLDTLGRWDGATATDLRWQTDLLLALIDAGLKPDDRRRLAVRDRLLKNLKQARLPRRDVMGEFEWCRSLRRVMDVGDGKTESQPIIAALVDHFEPLALDFVSLRGHPRFLQKKMSVDYREVPRHRVLQELQEQVLLTVWIEDELKDDKTPVSLKIEGTWQEVVDAVLAKTTYRMTSVEGVTYWIGNPMNEEAIANWIKTRLARIPAAGLAGDVLRQRSRVEFVETPLSDVCKHLSDLHGVEIKMVGDRGDRPIRENLEAPLYLVLSIIAKQADSDWIVVENTIFVGPRERLAELDK